jgi:hypothetical protein
MPVFSVRDIVSAPKTLLEETSSPRQRTILRNFMRHALLEVSGNWQEILDSDLTVERPVYRLFEGGQQLLLDGRDDVAAFYQALVGEGLNVFGPIEETVMVSDQGLALESFFGNLLTGRQAIALGHAEADPDGFYQLTRWFASFWPYDEDCRLVGEHIYENTGSRRFEPIDPADYIGPAEAAAQLADLLDESADWRRDLA